MNRVLLVLPLCMLQFSLAGARQPVHFSDLILKTAVEAELWITDPTPTDMLGLTELSCIDSSLPENGIISVEGLQYATNLQSLDLHGNGISDISPLSSLVHLQTLILRMNHISDLSPLSTLTDLRSLAIWDNQISDHNPEYIVIHGDHTIRANFASTSDVLYVDDDAPSDPRRGDPTESDPDEDGTREHPFDRIQEAVDVTTQETRICVRSGTYQESIDLSGKRVVLTGVNWDDPNRMDWPKIDGVDSGPCVLLTVVSP